MGTCGPVGGDFCWSDPLPELLDARNMVGKQRTHKVSITCACRRSRKIEKLSYSSPSLTCAVS